MAQICEVGVNGTRGDEFTCTGVDGSWTEMVNTDTLSLWQVLEGATLTGYCGSYTTGGGLIRIYNTVSRQVKTMALLNIITEEEFALFYKPVRVAKNDIIQVHTLAVA